MNLFDENMPYAFAFEDTNNVNIEPYKLLRKSAYNLREIAYWYYDVYCCQQVLIVKRLDYADMFENIMFRYEQYRTAMLKLQQ